MSDEFESASGLDARGAGTAAPAKLKKAGCGVRFDDDELRAGIDFSAAARLLPEQTPATPAPRDSDPGEDR